MLPSNLHSQVTSLCVHPRTAPRTGAPWRTGTPGSWRGRQLGFRSTRSSRFHRLPPAGAFAQICLSPSVNESVSVVIHPRFPNGATAVDSHNAVPVSSRAATVSFRVAAQKKKTKKRSSDQRLWGLTLRGVATAAADRPTSRAFLCDALASTFRYPVPHPLRRASRPVRVMRWVSGANLHQARAAHHSSPPTRSWPTGHGGRG